MNWIKKLFNQIEGEEKVLDIKREQERGTSGKDPHAKVAYQYPTGKFRFPLIPDEEQEKQPPRRAKREKAQQSPEQDVFVSEEEKKESNIKEEAPQKKDHGSKWKMEKKFEKVTKVDSQPFHPTEVPSPIYGNNPRPPKKIEGYVPEIELTAEMEISRRELDDTSTQEELFVSEEIMDSSALEEKTEIYDIQQDEAVKQEETVYHEEAIKQDEPINHEETIKQDEPINQEETINQEEPINYEETIEQEEPIYQEEPIKQDEYINHEEPIKQGDSINQEESIKQDESISQKGFHTAEKETAATAEADLKQEQKEEPKRKRQHVPFNVIMLKQDKRSLEQRRQRESQTSHSSQIQPKEEVHIIQEPAEDKVEQMPLDGEPQPYYQTPPLHFLSLPPQQSENDQEWVVEQKRLLDETLHHFRVGAKVVKATQGPSVTQFEVQPEPGVKVNKITNLSDDIKLSLSARDIRMEAPIPGKNTIGIEVPNRVSKPVFIREIIQHPTFIQHSSPLTVAMGLDISGKPVVLDLQKMPHGLIAGATGSGKSVCVNSIIMSLLYKSTPDEVKLLLIDPKMVELTPYNHIPHLVSPVITDVKAATAALKWAVEEMERRYELFVHAGVRDIGKFNELAKKHHQETLPYMVIIIDELADLMMVAPSDVEEAICRIAQKARACGMHLLIATQRPSVDVITGLIKANIPTRIAFSVSSQVDSRTIIDIGGAERLLGRGDMLLLENGAPKPIRVQGNFVADEEIERAVAHVRLEQKPSYLFEQSELLKENTSNEEDELFVEACQFVIEQNGASTSSLQRKFRIGYNRAARLMEMMENQGVISAPKGSKPRDVLVSEEDFMEWKDSDY